MAQKREVDPGLLKDWRFYPENMGTHYLLVSGINPHTGRENQFTTRGKGREKGATRIPFKFRFPKATAAARKIGRSMRDKYGMFELLKRLREEDYFRELSDFEVPLMVMPRAAEKTCGWEINAPGGTADPGESMEQIGDREFEEEGKGLKAIKLWRPFPPAMPASGAYDEIQEVTFALVYGEPSTLPEGAREWMGFNLGEIIDEMWKYNINPSAERPPFDAKLAWTFPYLIEKMKNELDLK
ncbi:hypothetical protein A3B18_03425 [Candidatus Giovannonibacteria bacterium RIFCSPLOWO2_01_FULL_46_13]|uniref:Nudix hydrolase domain-containing protein n=1 Tax=Candidatus Giovannonibacteria bacterium RIFCSPLOWO2_01_FULL_46_13 TaxID=1798352 RepID=A0A1F5X448_9BACT|nr:MAG: hypothetical protein A3B18_03425 [Candidatus Giovannonibacteria bacterium RIFCSPLOWO2_01_FULL_46_13]